MDVGTFLHRSFDNRNTGAPAPCAPQPPSSNTTTWVVLGAGDLLPEGGVAAQSGMLCGEHLDAIVTWI